MNIGMEWYKWAGCQRMRLLAYHYTGSATSLKMVERILDASFKQKSRKPVLTKHEGFLTITQQWLYSKQFRESASFKLHPGDFLVIPDDKVKMMYWTDKIEDRMVMSWKARGKFNVLPGKYFTRKRTEENSGPWVLEQTPHRG